MQGSLKKGMGPVWVSSNSHHHRLDLYGAAGTQKYQHGTEAWAGFRTSLRSGELLTISPFGRSLDRRMLRFLQANIKGGITCRQHFHHWRFFRSRI